MHDSLRPLTEVFRDENYLLWVQMDQAIITIMIVLKSASTSNDQVKAWVHGLICTKAIFDSAKGKELNLLTAVSYSLRSTNTLLVEGRALALLKAAGWTWDAALETHSGYRISISSNRNKRIDVSKGEGF